MPDEQVLVPQLRAVAARQRGVFTSAQAYAAGHGQREIQRLRRRHLLSLRRGVYVLREQYCQAEGAEQHGMRVAALALALTAPAVLSHETAAMELGLELLDPDLDRLHVTRPSGNGSRHEAGVEHHVGELPADQVLVLPDGQLPVTGVVRTAMDVALSTHRFECALAALDSARRLGASTRDLEAALDLCRGWPGARRASGAVALADGRAANPGESWSRAVLIEQGVEPEALQVPMYDAAGLIGIVDYWWKGVVGELDGKVKYRVPAGVDPAQAAGVVWREKVREDRLRVDNEVVRWSFADNRRPGEIGRRVRAALLRAERRGLR